MYRALKKNNLHGIGKIQYPSRVIGIGLACWIFAANQYYVGALNEPISIIYIIISLVYPHIALFIYWRSNSNKLVEQNMLLFDGFFAGSCVPIIGFNFLPSVVILTFTAAGNMVSKGFRQFIIGLGVITVGVVFGLLLNGFNFTASVHNEIGLLAAIAIFIIIYTWLFAYATNKSIIEVVKNRRLVRSHKDEIEKQGELIKGKNRDILDSIKYAKRIQDAILPAQETIDRFLPNSFIYYKPKDIVAGDFYWVERHKDIVLFAAADCTGHGVPGAMVSVVCHNALNRSVFEFGLVEPAKILDKTQELVLDAFKNSEVKDGMDIAICAIDYQNGKMKYAGANNSLYYIRNNQLIEIKSDKQPIGYTDMPVPFTSHEIDVKQGDQYYVFTDGFVDQFGDDNISITLVGGKRKGKKFKYKPFRDLLHRSANMSTEKQIEVLDKTLNSWMDGYEQIDDVCVIGVRI